MGYKGPRESLNASLFGELPDWFQANVSASIGIQKIYLDISGRKAESFAEVLCSKKAFLGFSKEESRKRRICRSLEIIDA